MNKKHLNIRILNGTFAQLRTIADETGISLNAMINIILGQYVERLKKEKEPVKPS